jgi:hypothetical protein
MNIVGPLRTLYNDVIGDSMQAFYEALNISVTKPIPGNYDIANRASIVTLFSRPSDVFLGTTFKMLFMGDAYDRDCNVAGTVAAFEGRKQPTALDILKVISSSLYSSILLHGNEMHLYPIPNINSTAPQVLHHCSDVTADAEFYTYIRARVYLISGKQSIHGAPALKTLLTIAAGFKQAPGTYDANVAPYYMFLVTPRRFSALSARIATRCNYSSRT